MNESRSRKYDPRAPILEILPLAPAVIIFPALLSAARAARDFAHYCPPRSGFFHFHFSIGSTAMSFCCTFRPGDFRVRAPANKIHECAVYFWGLFLLRKLSADKLFSLVVFPCAHPVPQFYEELLCRLSPVASVNYTTLISVVLYCPSNSLKINYECCTRNRIGYFENFLSYTRVFIRSEAKNIYNCDNAGSVNGAINNWKSARARAHRSRL